MNGNQAYKNQHQRKIDKLLENNQDKKYLKGFYNYISNSLSLSTIYDYISYVINFMNFNQKSVEDITLDDYTEFLSQIKDMTPSYQITVYSGLKKFSTYLLASKRNMDNAMAYISRPKYSEDITTIEKREKGYLDKKEIKKYIATVQSGTGSNKAIARQEKWKNRDMLIVLLLLTTGMRCSALYKIDVDSIDVDTKCLYVTDKGSKINKYNLPEEIIKCYLEWIKERDKLDVSQNEKALFISNQKTRMDQSSISRVVNKYSKNIDGKHITPHKLRATYGSQLYKQTKDLFFVQKCMGHSNPKVTELYIRDGNKNDRKNAAIIMSSAIFN